MESVLFVSSGEGYLVFLCGLWFGPKSHGPIRNSRFANVKWKYDSEATGHLRGAEDRGLRVSGAIRATRQ